MLWYGSSLCRGMRSGTVPHTLVAGLGEACCLAGEEMSVSVTRGVVFLSLHLGLDEED